MEWILIPILLVFLLWVSQFRYKPRRLTQTLVISSNDDKMRIARGTLLTISQGISEDPALDARLALEDIDAL